jgi:hypothetical protein
MLILGLFLFAIALGLFVLALVGMALMIVLKVFAAILWLAIKLTERWSVEPLITIVIDDEHPTVMKDVTPTVPKLDRW